RSLLFLCSLLLRSSPFCVLLSFPTRRSSDLCIRKSQNFAHLKALVSFSAVRYMRAAFFIRSALLILLFLNASVRLSISFWLPGIDRKSTRLNSSHVSISYVVFCFNKTTHYLI